MDNPAPRPPDAAGDGPLGETLGEISSNIPGGSLDGSLADTTLWDHLLDTASSLPWVLGIFLAFLLLFHVLLVGLLPLTARQWKLAEYVWVAMAFISSLGFVDEARRYRAELHLADIRAPLEASRRDVTDWFDSYQIYACEEAPAAPGDIDPGATAFAAVCDWFSARQRDLTLLQMEDRITPDLGPSLLRGAGTLAPVLMPENIAIIRERLAVYQTLKARYRELMAARRRGTLQKILIMLAPILLSAALALKITKVTGEYRLMR